MEVKFGKCDYDALKKNYKESLQDEKFSKLVSHLDISEEELMRHTTKLQESVIELENCKCCKSIHECKNRITGSVFFRM